MQYEQTVAIASIAQLTALSCEPKQGTENVRKIRLGSFPTRAQHTGTSPLKITVCDSLPLAALIRSFANLEDIECGDVRWNPVNTRALLPITTNAMLAYAVRPAVATEASEDSSIPNVPGLTAPLVLPENDVVEGIAGEEPRGRHDVHVVQVCVVPLAATAGDTLSLASGGDFREVVVHVTGVASIAAIHDFIFANGANILDLTLRWHDASALRGIYVHALVNELGIASRMSLSSLTLVYTLIPGESFAAYAQWQLNLAVVKSIVASDLRRLRLVIKVEEVDGCHETWGQVKQMRWQDLVVELSRFAKLQKIEVIVIGEGKEDSEIWQEIEQRLRGTLPGDVRLVQGYFCIL